MTAAIPVETFASLAALPGIVHGFAGRMPGLDVQVDREGALARLVAHHDAALRKLGLTGKRFAIAQQVHGHEVAVVDHATPFPVAGVDGLITTNPEVCLGIYVADCCAVYLVEPERRVIALLHAGRKGSELGITAAAIARMRAEFGCDPAKMIAQLSPCIRPPNFEIDFAALIIAQCRAAGVQQVFDCGTCTASNPARYYSYRAERGKTGRMLAFLALTE